MHITTQTTYYTYTYIYTYHLYTNSYTHNLHVTHRHITTKTWNMHTYLHRRTWAHAET